MIREVRTIAELMIEAEAEDQARRAEYERRLADLSERLDALLLSIPALHYSGIGSGDGWPVSRYDEVFRAATWLGGFKRHDKNPRCSSYYLKHGAESATGIYISNGSLIAAAVLCGIPTAPSRNSPNAIIAIPIPAAKAATAVADGTATFRELVIIEPELKRLADDAKAYKRESRGQPIVCANSRWYGYYEWREKGLKKQFRRLVGWESDNPILSNEHAYEVAYDAICALLPDCKGCNCHGVAP